MTTGVGVSTTYFIGNHYEVTDGVVTKYYYAGSQRIAMRKGGTLNYLLGDHLGSTSLVTDATGNIVSQQKYKAWGETRYSSGNEVTKYQYTGQYSYTSDFGLMFYNARWYDPSLSRFAQADSIVPPGVQGLDRYAYVNNSPMVYVDPSGHESVCGQANSDPECGNLGHSPLSHPSGGNTSNGNGGSGIILQQHHEADEGNTVYIGGATPAGIPGFEADGEGKYPPVEVFADWLEIVSMYSPNSPATLGVFLTYFTDTKGNVIKLELTIVNNGETSATLEYIDLSEETLPSFTSCTLNTTCHFKPQSPVNIDPGQVGSVTICQNCLADNTSTFSHPFNNNKYNRIGVKAALSMLIDWGYEGTRRSPIPFMYTIPRR